MSTSGERIKVRFVYKDEIYGLKKDRVYDAIKCPKKFGGAEMLSISNIDGDGEEYGYPASWFETVE